MAEKKRRTHDLNQIQRAFATTAGLRRTLVSARDAAALGMDAAEVVQVTQSLRYPEDFQKSATAHHDHTRWHDSYRCSWNERALYLKFTTDTGGFLLTSFKES